KFMSFHMVSTTSDSQRLPLSIKPGLAPWELKCPMCSTWESSPSERIFPFYFRQWQHFGTKGNFTDISSYSRAKKPPVWLAHEVLKRRFRNSSSKLWFCKWVMAQTTSSLDSMLARHCW